MFQKKTFHKFINNKHANLFILYNYFNLLNSKELYSLYIALVFILLFNHEQMCNIERSELANRVKIDNKEWYNSN
jgi:hypothetical protein